MTKSDPNTGNTNLNAPDYASRTRTPFHCAVILYAVLDNPRVSRDIIERDSLLGVKHE